MKILAATPQQYADTVYIAELTSSELVALTILRHYDEIPVKSGTGQQVPRKRDDLKAGDSIDPAVGKQAREEACALIDAHEEIRKSFAVLRGAMTKVQKATACEEGGAE